jgi:hypothetical protein
MTTLNTFALPLQHSKCSQGGSRLNHATRVQRQCAGINSRVTRRDLPEKLRCAMTHFEYGGT